MNKITVIGTIHAEGGACTSDELIKIVQKLSPNVIFFEASPETFPAMLKATENFNIPEIKAVRTIIEKHSVDIIPVDLYGDPFDRRLAAMEELFRTTIRDYFCASEILAIEAFKQGFSYLNSEDCDQIHKDKTSMAKIFVAKTMITNLSQAHMDWLKWNDKREDHWINVIHDYFNNKNNTIAVFLVGAAHRIRLMDKIKNSKSHSESIPTWDFYPFKLYA